MCHQNAIRFRQVHLLLAACLVGPVSAAAQEKQGLGRLEHVDRVTRNDLASTISAQVSADGKYVYAAAYNASGICVFARDAATGRLEHLQTVSGTELDGAATLRISRDGRYAISPAFRAKAVVLFERNDASGKLTQLSVVRHGDANLRFQWPIDAVISHDSRFVYVVDPYVTDGTSSSRGSLTVFRIEGGRLAWVETTAGRDGCLMQARGIDMHPDGKAIYVASADANTVTVFGRDGQSGKVTVQQVLTDEQDGVHALEGAMAVHVSPDGRHVYVSAGRFSGDNAVSVYEVASDKTLKVAQELINGTSDLANFEGGNEIVVTPDGRNVYAVATLSCTVACFEREPATGRLTYVETLDDGGGPRIAGQTLGAAGIGVSPDGRSVYVACENKNSLSIFRRAVDAPPAK